MDVAIGFYHNRVVAWRVGTSSNPQGPQVVYREQGRPSLFSVQAKLEERGFRLVIVFEEEGGGVGIRLLA